VTQAVQNDQTPVAGAIPPKSALPASSADRNRANLELARTRAAELRALGQTPEHLDPLERARRNPQSLALAVVSRCWECVGCDADPDPRGNIRDCKVSGCPLRPLRPYAGPVSASRRAAINAKCKRCMGPDPNVNSRIRECHIATCPLHPVRPYQGADDSTEVEQ
jgi:hypothetical protein